MRLYYETLFDVGCAEDPGKRLNRHHDIYQKILNDGGAELFQVELPGLDFVSYKPARSYLSQRMRHYTPEGYMADGVL